MSKGKPICLIITDSVALPRKYSDEIVNWDETYPVILKKNLMNFEVITLSIGGATITDLRNQVNYYKILKPNLVILQCGIVDAAPRAFGRIEMEIIKKWRLFRITKPLVSLLRKYRAHNYTSPRLFEIKLRELKKELNADFFYALEILPACSEYEKHLPGIARSITIYNNILKKNSILIPLQDIPREGILKDYHHINAIGHEFVFRKIQEFLSTTLEKKKNS
jgi:hypothetical protein